MRTRRMLQIVAMLLIGEGVLYLLIPRRYLLLWKFGSEGYQEMIEELAARPGLLRLLGLLEVAAGVGLALTEKRRFS